MVFKHAPLIKSSRPQPRGLLSNHLGKDDKVEAIYKEVEEPPFTKITRYLKQEWDTKRWKKQQGLQLYFGLPRKAPTYPIRRLWKNNAVLTYYTTSPLYISMFTRHIMCLSIKCEIYHVPDKNKTRNGDVSPDSMKEICLNWRKHKRQLEKLNNENKHEIVLSLDKEPNSKQTSWRRDPSTVLKIRTSVPLELAVAMNRPSWDNAKQAILESWAMMNLVRFAP